MRFWTGEEINYLKENYLTKSNFEILKVLNRTYDSLSAKLNKLRLKRPKEFTYKNVSERMKKENPMFNNISINKMKRTIKERYPNWGDFCIGKPRPDLRKSNLENNPLRNPEIKKKAIKNHKKSLKEKYKNIEEKKDFNKRMLNAQHKRPTEPEKIMIEIIKENNFPFKYVGNGELCIGGFFPDFINEEKRLILEVNGKYWHSLPIMIEKDIRKYEEYKRQGYCFLVIWDYELKNKNEVINRVNELMNMNGSFL